MTLAGSGRLPRPGAVLFDLDGTLVDTVPTRIVAWRRAFEHVGIATTREQVAAYIGCDGRRLAKAAAQAVGRHLDDRQAGEVDRLAGSIYEELNTDPRPLPGMRRLVRVLEASGVPWAIGTSSGRDQVVASLRAMDLHSTPRIVDGSQVRVAKPEPDLLLQSAAVLEVRPSRCWYVGDSVWDVRAAIAAGMTPIAVLAGSAASATELRSEGAAAVVRDLAAVASLLSEALQA